MTEEKIKEKLRAIVRKYARSPLPIKPDLALAGEHGLHTLDTLQIIMDAEDYWEGQLFITDEEAERVRTMGDLEAIVIAKLTNPEGQPA